MAFRANEEEASGREITLKFLTGPNIDPSERSKSREALNEIIDRLGPVVRSYPTWHPLVSQCKDVHSPTTTPDPRCGYRGLDHTVFLRSGFITCPYSDGREVIAAVNKLAASEMLSAVAELTADVLDVQLYHPETHPVLVTCKWANPLSRDGTIPARLAVPLILEKEIPAWRLATRAETWETMRSYLLGTPCGARSSLFVNEKTGQTIKNLWNTLVNTGMFGPIKFDD